MHRRPLEPVEELVPTGSSAHLSLEHSHQDGGVNAGLNLDSSQAHSVTIL